MLLLVTSQSNSLTFHYVFIVVAAIPSFVAARIAVKWRHQAFALRLAAAQ
jgi:hypothetical protein